MRMRSPMRYAANRAGRTLARSYVRQQRRNTYVNKQNTYTNNKEVKDEDIFAVFITLFVLFIIFCIAVGN
jgi:hypothetical protein